MALPKTSFALLLTLCFTLTAYTQQKDRTDSRLAGIDTLLTSILKDHNAAGVSVAIIEGDKLLYSKGFGYRDLQQKKPATANTLFAIGSCTKAFTASLLGQLEQKGAVSLDGKCRDYLPNMHFYNADLDNSITIRDMMCHRTGIAGYEKSWYVFNTPARDSIMTRIQFMKPTMALREKWQYNNYMYLLQGMIAEKITGKTWEDNIKTQIFTPLGMKRSNTSIVDLAKDEDAALPYSTEEEGTKQMEYYDMEGMAPCGGINSSANEMGAWLTTWINNGKYNGTEVLPAGYVSAATSAQMVVNGGQPGDQTDVHFLNYGLGWFLRSYRGHYQVEHDGNIDGFSSWIAFFPKEKIGIVVLVNQQFSRVPEMVSNSLADRLLQLKPVEWNHHTKNDNPTAAPISGRIPHTTPSHPLNQYQGTFENPAYGDIHTYSRNDSLFGTIGKTSVWLNHYHYDVFEAKRIHPNGKIDTTTDLRINFRFGENGKIESITLPLEASIDPIVEFKHTEKVVVITKADALQYTGEYTLGDMIAKVYLKDDRLFLLAPGQPEYELIPLGDHRFNLTGLPGYHLEFESAAKGATANMTAFTFFKPDGTSFKVTKKK